jgi:DNA-binding transcriptional ArsR family regulator
MSPSPSRGAALDAVFAALANEHRRRILARLASGDVTTPQIALEFDFSKQALSRHMAVLEDAGLVNRAVHGRLHELAFAPEPLDGVSHWIFELRRGWKKNLDRLDRVLRAHHDE